METPFDRLAKLYANCFGRMTKMAMLPIYGKNPLNIFFPESGRPMTLGLGNLALGMCSPTRLHKSLFSVDLDLLYL